MAENISVIAAFRDGEILPILFRRGRRRHRVEDVACRWQSRCGREKIYHFSAVSGADLYHLCFFSESLLWRLEEVQEL